MFAPIFFERGDNMDEREIRFYFRKMLRMQEIMVEQLSSICKVLADKEGLAIEEGECEDEIIGVDK